MAINGKTMLQSSGPISISDIKTELGSSDNSLRILSSDAGFSKPDAMSEFYSFSSFSNDYALDYDGVNDEVEGATNGNIPNQTFTVSMWIRVDATTKHNMVFYGYVGTLDTIANDRLLIYYGASTNRLIVQFRKGNGQLYRREYPLHDNSGVTGITNSTTGWVASQRGNTDAAGFTHLCFALNQTNGSATSGIKTYWNGNEMTSSVNNRNDFTTALNPSFLAIGDVPNVVAPAATIMEGVLDEIYLYDAQLSAANVNTIYGFGRDTENTYTTNFVTAWRMENDVTDTNSITTLTNNGATFITTP